MVSDDVRERVLSYIRHQAGKSRSALIELVTSSQCEFIDTVAGVDDATADRQPAPGEWSLRELVRHVISAEAGVAAIVEQTARGKQPSGARKAGTMADDGGAPFVALIDRLRETNTRLLDVIAALPAEPDTSVVSSHPFFGDLNCLEWAAFQRVHDADHIQHAGKILAALRGTT
jgi:hypothetical protein